MNADFKNRLLNFLSHLNIGQTAFEEKVGLSRGVIWKIKDGMNAASLKKIMDAYPSLNMSWLLTGEGEMIKQDPSLGDSGGVEIVHNSGPTPYLQKRRDLKNHQAPFLVPLVPIAAQAGYAQHCFDMTYIEKLETYPILPGVDPHGAAWRYFQVQGESMEDTLRDGQFILTSQVIKEDWRNVETSYVYVVITKDGVIVKRLYKVKGKDYWAAVSDNPDEAKYPQFRLYVKDVLELWKFRRKVDWDARAPRKVEIKV